VQVFRVGGGGGGGGCKGLKLHTQNIRICAHSSVKNFREASSVDKKLQIKLN
jgi:hypothetical protein